MIITHNHAFVSRRKNCVCIDRSLSYKMLHFCCSICYYSSSSSLQVKRHSLRVSDKNVYLQANKYVKFIKSQTGEQTIDEKDIRAAKISRIQSSAQNINVSLTESLWISLCLRSHTLPVINH